MTDYQIRDARPDDIDAVVAIHLAGFPDSFSTKMGAGFLRHTYQTVLEHPGGMLVVAEDGGEVVGFNTGFGDPAGYFARYRRKRWRIAPHILLAVLRRPALARLVWANLKRVGSPIEHPDWFEWSSMGVRADQRGRGIASAVTKALLDGARDAGFTQVYGYTETTNDILVRIASRHPGFTPKPDVMHAGRMMTPIFVTLGEASYGDGNEVPGIEPAG